MEERESVVARYYVSNTSHHVVRVAADLHAVHSLEGLQAPQLHRAARRIVAGAQVLVGFESQSLKPIINYVFNCLKLVINYFFNSLKPIVNVRVYVFETRHFSSSSWVKVASGFQFAPPPPWQ